MWIDIGKLIRESVPDKNGKALPASVTSGSYEIWDLNNKASGTLFEGKVIYDKTYGHVTYGCGSCCGYRNTRLFFDPLDVIYSGSAGNGVDGLDSCAGQWYDISDSMYGNWSTANGAIATVDYYGTHTGQSVGYTTSSTFGGPFDIASIKVVCPVHDLGAGGKDNVIQVQVTNVDLTSDQVKVNLQGPSGISGTLLVTWNGPGPNQPIANTNEGVGTYTFNPPLGGLVPGQYTGVTAQWLGASNTYSTSFDVLGSYLHTQYNSPAESQCSGASGTAYLTPGPSACAWNTVNLIQQFISQAWINGSGYADGSSHPNYGPCQEYLAGCSPPPAGNQNYFREVSTITPGCGGANNFLSSTSVAVDVSSPNHPLGCGDQVLIVGLGGGVGTVKTVTDSCPACNGAAHIDDYNTSNACSLTSLGNFTTIRINR